MKTWNCENWSSAILSSFFSEGTLAFCFRCVMVLPRHAWIDTTSELGTQLAHLHPFHSPVTLRWLKALLSAQDYATRRQRLSSAVVTNCEVRESYY